MIYLPSDTFQFQYKGHCSVYFDLMNFLNFKFMYANTHEYKKHCRKSLKIEGNYQLADILSKLDDNFLYL